MSKFPNDSSLGSIWRSLGHATLAIVAVASAVVLGAARSSPAEAAATAGPTVTVTGHGWGHGRGMGQYGAYGYARDHGWTSAQILNHYYGGTVAGPVPAGAAIDPDAVRVEIRDERDRGLTVGLASGTIQLLSTDGSSLGSISDPYVRLTYTSEGHNLETGPTCSGPWEQAAVYPDTTVRLLPETTSVGASGALHLCEANGVTWYGGELQAVYYNARSRVVNVVDLDTYLRGVVPREIPASWSMAALEVQAVAARSYVMAGDTRQLPYADTCNTILCQVYDGLYQDDNANGPTATTRTTTDTAIANTSDNVRIASNGTIARTEFSSSTGGYTTGGTFPAVVDAGDSVSANPNHNWSTTVDLTSLEASYNLGRLRALVVTERNGLGADGGRVETVRLEFESGSVTRTGNSIRQALGLKSDWFSFGAVVRPIDETHQYFLDAAFETFVGRDATVEETAYWLDRLEVVSREVLIAALVRDEGWVGPQIEDLYQRALGRASDVEGRAYWLSILNNNVRLEYIGVQFYGSQEYFNRSGGTNRAFVTQLYRNVLLREPDAGGLDYWVSQIDKGAWYDVIASSFYYSVESRRTRAANLFETILGRSGSEAEIAQRADDLLGIDDLDLAVVLGSSEEFFQAAQR